MYSPELLAAVAVLDKDQPGWWRKVDLGNFDLGLCTSCVVGQVYGSQFLPDTNYRDAETVAFYTTMKRLFGEESQQVFWRRGDEAPAGMSCFYEMPYEHQWRSLISERQATDNLILSAPPCEEVEGYERVMA